MDTTNNILISVILPVRNGEKYICQSIESVLAQTYANFELIIINDGSTDNTESLIKSYSDSRINLVTTEGVGLVKSLNMGTDLAKGKYIARMDTDDICMPERFLMQVKILNENENTGVVCSDVELIDENDNHLGYGKDIIKNQKSFINGLILKKYSKPVVHPSVRVYDKIPLIVNYLLVKTLER
jgi:glycosyltransferase involved in cell wall biosynthesis